MKSIFNVENSLTQQLLTKLNKNQINLIEKFVDDADSYTQDSLKVSEFPHMDGVCERWEVRLNNDFSIYIDCNIPGPWGATEKHFGTVMIIGYKLNKEVYLITN